MIYDIPFFGRMILSAILLEYDIVECSGNTKKNADFTNRNVRGKPCLVSIVSILRFGPTFWMIWGYPHGKNHPHGASHEIGMSSLVLKNMGSLHQEDLKKRLDKSDQLTVKISPTRNSWI